MVAPPLRHPVFSVYHRTFPMLGVCDYPTQTEPILYEVFIQTIQTGRGLYEIFIQIIQTGLGLYEIFIQTIQTVLGLYEILIRTIQTGSSAYGISHTIRELEQFV